MIDYSLIVKAQKFYEKHFLAYDANWLVFEEAIRVTLPENRKIQYLKEGEDKEKYCLVGSGEQSFIQAMLEDSIDNGKWYCITSCFRNEPKYDELTKPYFLKLELIDINPPSPLISTVELAWLARDFFTSLDISGKLIETDEGLDYITDSGVELGSYGKRTYKGWTWVYGTGIAEPRTSFVMNTQIKSV